MFKFKKIFIIFSIIFFAIGIFYFFILNFQSNIYEKFKKTMINSNLKFSDSYKEKKINSIKLNKDPLVLYFYKEHSKKIFPENPTKINHCKTLNIDDNLILSPGYYCWDGKTFKLNKEGLYYFIDFNKKISRYLIIYKKDIIALLSSISWLITHGNQDINLSFSEKIRKIKTKKLSLTCGYTSKFTSTLLRKLNIENRIITFLTMDTWNTYDNGHTLIEVKIDSDYILFDIDNNQYFEINGKNLSAKDFLYRLDFSKIKFIKLSKDSYVDVNGFYSDKINYVGVSDYVNLNIREWYTRVMQIPIILSNGNYYVGLPNNDRKLIRKVLTYYPSAILLNKEEFEKKFYGDTNENTHN